MRRRGHTLLSRSICNGHILPQKRFLFSYMFTKTQLAGGQPLGQSARYIAAKLASNLVIYRGWKRNDSTVMVHGPDMNLSSLTVSKV